MKKFLTTILALSFLVAFWSFASAQDEVGTLTGTVTDLETGEPLADAKINICWVDSSRGGGHGHGNGGGNHGGGGHNGGGGQYSAITDENGNYTIEDIPVGIYIVKATKRQYIRQEVETEIIANDVTVLDFVLEHRYCVNPSRNSNGNQ